MHFIKLVSDAGERIDQSKITELFALQEDKICGYIDILLSVGGNKTSIDDKTKGEIWQTAMRQMILNPLGILTG